MPVQSDRKVVEKLEAGDVIRDPEFDEPIKVYSVEVDEEHVIVYGRMLDQDGRKVELIYGIGHEVTVNGK